MNVRRPIVVAWSGGKDSTAAILLCREQGFRVEGVTMRLGTPGEEARLERIKNLARQLALPWSLLDLRGEFREQVIGYFLDAYRSGFTPNPCMACNRALKFGLLAEQTGADGKSGLLATGHYAATVRDESGLFLTEPREHRKSQIYFLGLLGPEKLARAYFPLANRTIDEVRSLTAGLPLGNREESQDACFLAGIDLVEFLRERIPDGFVPGDILDIEGKPIGRHDGVISYTVGQRRGTHFASTGRLYVIRTDAKNNTITLGEDHHLWSDLLTVAEPVYWRPLTPGETLRVKIRSQHGGDPAKITATDDLVIQARFTSPIRALTPGQFAVFYNGDRITAAGTIMPGSI